jgi:hypothetical protein
MRLALLVCVAALVVGCGGSGGGSGDLDSGIRGRAVIQSCGVPFSEEDCRTPPPYTGEINVRRTYGGPVVRTIRAGADGRFVVGLEPGRYILDWEPEDVPWPFLKPVEVTVRAHQYTQVTLSFDSGIR